MMDWLLQRLEQEPRTSFNERELRGRAQTEFDDLRRSRLLRRDPIPSGSFRRVVRGRMLHYVSGPDGSRVGVDVEDPESEPVPFAAEDVGLWRVDVSAVVEGLRSVYGLGGRPRPLTERLHFVGERMGEDSPAECYVLALVAPGAAPVDQLAALPTLLGFRGTEIVVLCPSFRPIPAERELLRSIGVRVVGLEPETARSSSADGRHWAPSPQYDSITCEGEHRALTKNEAAIIQELDRARLGGNPYRSLRELFDLFQRPPGRLRDLFSPRNRDLIGSLVVSEEGGYRLNLPAPTGLPT